MRREDYVWSIGELQGLAQLDTTLPFDAEDWVPVIRHALAEARQRLATGEFSLAPQAMAALIQQFEAKLNRAGFGGTLH